ncbi:hypothetical protein EK904_006269, partial [Melospiza melodia maxima]
TPRTCENFIKLCKKNYYDGTIFHRSIRNFVEENLTGENLSKMNSSPICPTRDVVFLVWQIQDPTQTNHS